MLYFWFFSQNIIKRKYLKWLFLHPKNSFSLFQQCTKGFNLDTIARKKNDKNWPYRMLVIGPSRSGKTNVLLNLIQKDNGNFIDKIYSYPKDLDEPKYQFLIKKREDAGIKNLNDPSVFIEYSNTMDYVYNNIDHHNLKRKRKILIVFHDMIADIMSNKRFEAIIKELFIRCRKLNISLVFITQSYFSVPEEVRLNSTHYLIMKIHNKTELENIATNHSADIDYKDFLKIYKNCTKGSYSFLPIDTTLTADNPVSFRKEFSDSFIKMT